MSQWKIPFFDSDIGKEEIAEVVKVMESRWLTMGDLTRQFETQFSEFIGCKHAFVVSNGTTALHLANVALNIGPGDEVLVPSLTFVATANSILYCGATPVFVDITSENDFNISPDDIEKKISQKTKAIMVVHYAGYPCDMSRIMDIAQQHGLSVIEDVAHAPGASINGKTCGTFGRCGCFSFFSNKNMATGEGGMLVTDDDKIAEKLKLIRSHGMTTLTLDRYKGHAYSYDVVELGYNYRTSEMVSAIGIVQLKKLTAKNKRREELVNLYRTLLSRVDKIIVPFDKHPGNSSYHIFPILLDRGVDRQKLMEYLKENGIQTSIHYPPIHQFTYHRKLNTKNPNLPFTEDIANREVTLPLYPQMSNSDVEIIVKHIESFITTQD
jgi:dTDP-4-amino-4,6-dideoxygalactose transaminase